MEEKRATVVGWLTMADQKLEVAEMLFEAGYFDDAISRAYYGMFYATKAALLSIDIEVKSHAGLVNQFALHFVKTGKVEREYNRMLSTAMQMREMSDYSLQVTSTEAHAAGIIADLKLFIQKIKQILVNV
jgi:uncharacterized protein (UPF0332 family)